MQCTFRWSIENMQNDEKHFSHLGCSFKTLQHLLNMLSRFAINLPAMPTADIMLFHTYSNLANFLQMVHESTSQMKFLKRAREKTTKHQQLNNQSYFAH